jgi:hypothetical protein
MKIHTALFVTLSLLILPNIGMSDDVNDLIETILEASPQQRAKVASYKKVQPKSSSSRPRKAAVPNMGIPANKLLEVGSKFPKNPEGFYIYGPVTLKTISREETGEPCLPLWSRNARRFLLYTRDPQVLAAFSGGWGSRYMIPKECPLKIVAKDVFPGTYAVRLPFDRDTKNYTLKETVQDSTKEIKGIFDQMGRDIQETIRQAGQQ